LRFFVHDGNLPKALIFSKVVSHSNSRIYWVVVGRNVLLSAQLVIWSLISDSGLHLEAV
jgi:hypothetical protein